MSAEAELCFLLGPVEWDAGADDALKAEVGGLGPGEDWTCPVFVESVWLTGRGGARSAVWPQMIADITGKAVDLFDGREFGAQGAALLARVAVGELPDIAAAAALVPPLRATVMPDPSCHAAYALARQTFQRHRQKMLGRAC